MLTVLSTGDKRPYCLTVLAQVPKGPDSLAVVVPRGRVVAQGYRFEHTVEVERALGCGHELSHRAVDWPYPPPRRAVLLVAPLPCFVKPKLGVE